METSTMCLFDGQRALDEVEVAGLEGDELTPPQSGVDGGLHHQPVLGGEGGQDGVVLGGVRVRVFFLMTLGARCGRRG